MIDLTKKAVLIGSQTFGLEGCHNDLKLLKPCLLRRGFQVECFTGVEATRTKILRRFRMLICEASAEDIIVIFFSGHGGLAANPKWSRREAKSVGQPRFFQFILPTDMDKSQEGDFRGILNWELSHLTLQLTQKTQNVTLLLDCCHSASMVRGMRTRGLTRVWETGVGQHLEHLRIRQNLQASHQGGNPHVVRLVAAGRHQSAFEYNHQTKGTVGLFSESLVQALSEAQGALVSWGTLLKGIRERVMLKQPWQRPEAEGPSHRLLFESQEVDHHGGLTFFFEGSPMFPKPALRGGRFLGVEVGNVYALMPRGAMALDTHKQLGKATVTQVSGATSRVRIQPPFLPPGLMAFPIETTSAKFPVALQGDLPQDLSVGISRSVHLRIAAKNESPMVTVRGVFGSMTLWDKFGKILRQSLTDCGQVLQFLVAMAQSCRLRVLDGGTGADALGKTVEFEWGRVVQGKAVPFARPICQLYSGDRICSRVVNRGAKVFYVHWLDIGVSYRVQLCNRSQLSGSRVRPGEEVCLGTRSFGGLAGLKVAWPRTVPTAVPRMGTWCIVISDLPQDLTLLESSEIKQLNGSQASPSDRWLERVRSGSQTQWADEKNEKPLGCHALFRKDFLLHSQPRPQKGR